MHYTEQLLHDFERFKAGIPAELEAYVLDTYKLSLASVYGRHTIKNTFGKASGQLSLNVNQIERDIEA